MTSKRFAISAALISLMLLTSILLAQESDAVSFTLIQQIGRARPSSIVYDANFDQLAMVNVSGQLVLADAETFTTRHTLYNQGPFNDYVFSHNGRYLALAIDRRVEIWDTQTGELDISLEPEGSLGVSGPLQFADDDQLLRFDSIVPEPAATRVSENDTSLVPWLWDLPAARREAQSTLPNRARAYPFFDYRYGFVLGPNDLVIAALPQRLQLVDASNSELQVIGEIQSNRNERDPISVWQSARDDLLYVRPINTNSFVQIDPESGRTFEFFPGRDLSTVTQLRSATGGLHSQQDIIFNSEGVTIQTAPGSQASVIAPPQSGPTSPNEITMQPSVAIDERAPLSVIENPNAPRFSNQAQVIGQPSDTTTVPLLELFLGEGYLQTWNYHPLTVMLLDVLVPVTPAATDTAVMLYIYDETRSVGTIDLVILPDVMHLELSPNDRQLVVRRSYGEQAIEIYDLNTGLLERTIYPAIQDPGGQHLFALTQDGNTILSDFERFDVNTGEVLRQDITLSTGFSDYAFSLDGERLVTLRGNEWWVWEIATSTLIRKETLRLRGELVDVSPDAHRYLTRLDQGSSMVMEVTDVGGEMRQSVEIDTRSGRLVNVIPSPGWSRFLAIYSNNDIALYDIEMGQRHYIAYDDLPASAYRFGWVNEETAFAIGNAGGRHSQRIYGVDYHVSGLPSCVVEAYPSTWMELLPLWEQFSAYMGGERLAQLALMICDNLPATLNGLIDSLTPTPGPQYNVAATRPAYAVAGVPPCLTSRFPGEALAYAELWRDMSTGLDEAALEELETLICEGLLSSISSVGPTATADPIDVAVELTSTAQAIRDNPSTPTLGPEQANTNMSVMLIDAESGVRSLGSDLPQQAEPPNNNLILEAFRATHGFVPQNPRISQDGTRLVGTNPSNYLVVYQMEQPYAAIAANATATIEARRTNEAHRIALRPTSTPTFSVIGTARPTITPTITPTIPPPAEAIFGDPEVTDVCQAEEAFSIQDAPADFAPPGSLLVQMIEQSGVWRLDPGTGELHPDERLPDCLVNGNCSLSFDQAWILQNEAEIAVSQLDGDDRQVLFHTYEAPVFPQQLYWTVGNQVEYYYQGYLDNRPTILFRQYDPMTQALSEPFPGPEPISINNLNTEIVAEQPGRGSVLARTYFDTGNGHGYKYYIYNRETESADFFTRVYPSEHGDLVAYWHPTGDYLYYRIPGEHDWHVYDARTHSHFRLGPLPEGLWSKDARYRVQWIKPDFEPGSGPVPKLSVWDSATNQTRRYCLPGTGYMGFDGTPLLWSPDNRYIAFRALPVARGDDFLTPTAVTTATSTPVPTFTLEEQRDHSLYNVYIIDLHTGAMAVIDAEETQQLLLWTSEEYTP